MTDAVPDERTLVARAAAGDAAAFEGLVRAHHARAWRVALRMLGNAADAQDAVQESFVAAYQALPRFRVGQPFVPWLITIVTRRCLNTLRGRQRRPVGALDERIAAPDAWGDPARASERREAEAALQAALATLGEVARAVVVLYYTEGLPCARIGEALDMSESAVKVALFRARGRLRECLKREGDDPHAM